MQSCMLWEAFWIQSWTSTRILRLATGVNSVVESLIVTAIDEKVLQIQGQFGNLDLMLKEQGAGLLQVEIRVYCLGAAHAYLERR